MKQFVTLVVGLLFGAGLTVAQMVSPDKVLNFLDVAGDWDASLVFVMIGALLVFSIGFKLLVIKMNKPYLNDTFEISCAKDIDSKLIIGACLFGVGWGLTGICPGPAIANFLTFNHKMIVFTIAMLCGIWLHKFHQKRVR